MDRLVYRVCAARGHQQPALFDSASAWAPNTLTLVETKWAYCPAGERDGHDWRQTEARLYAQLRDEAEERIRSTP